MICYGWRMDENWKKYIEEQKEKYNEIGQITCPVFGNELIHFNKYGFNHLVRKGRFMRPRNEQRKRFNLLPYALFILEKNHPINEYRENYTDNSNVQFWAFEAYLEDSKVKIIIRKKNGGPLHFFSVYSNKP